MKADQVLAPAKRVLVLFPSGRVGRKVVEQFAAAGYDVVTVVLESGKSETSEAKVTAVPLEAPGDAFWDGLAPEVREKLLDTPVVIYHAGKDFLRLTASGTGEEWQLNPRDEAQRRFGFVEQLLSKLAQHPPALWVNLAIGVTGLHGEKGSYCRTRYGLLGFTQSLSLNPAFRGMKIRNVCLSYFHDHQRGRTSESCERCTVRQSREDLAGLRDENELIAYLVRESDKTIAHLAPQNL